MNDQERHNRTVMLRRVKTVWLDGVLEESLHGGEIIDLGFAYRPAALGNSGVPSWQQAPEYDYLLPVGTRIEDVFAAADRVLLVLGEPGAGKTTMLLQLVSHLMAQAEADETCPMPAVFSLATYTNGRTLSQWLVEQLAGNYEVPRKLGEQWIDAGQFIPLLDGLDEVDPAHRPACAEAINEFRARHPGVPLLVTARNRDYQALATRLHMDKAIILQPLTLEQIDTYLQRRGNKLDGLRASLAADHTLQELAQTPLMLSIMTLAANRPPESGAADLGDGLLSRQHLFDVYVERMARYRGKNMSYSPSDTISWLSWLAKQQTRAMKPTFFLEDMQPSWLPDDAGRGFVRQMRLSVFGILAGAAVPGALLLLLYNRWGAAGALLLVGLFAAAVPAITGRFLVRGRLPFKRIETVESLGWSWPWAALGFGTGAAVGLGLGALVAWLDRWTSTPWPALLSVAGGVLTMVENALLRSDLRLRTTPGQGVEQSRRNGLMVAGLVIATTLILGAVAVAVAAAVTSRQAFIPAAAWLLWLALFLGAGCGLSFGFLAWLQHWRLRSILHDRGDFPDDATAFLNLAAERNLLRKVGGGYTFVHALLLDYFSRRGEQAR
ncbi:MAG TPA: NACHT domain-containing protein [Promineifilum sp.]|nr:NACHT domain-containing protein [Promineifilum sp.]HRO89213.1 NACHT domain-containing protein [Promineifilum sp.]HRQ13324.1 NACHT domain-containing protein [Promineifilum sp.]